MLRINYEINGKKYTKDIIVIDSHSHLGIDVDGSSMQNPMAPGQGTFDFWGKIENMIRTDFSSEKMQSNYSCKIGKKMVKIGLDFIQLPIFSQINHFLEKRNKSGRFNTVSERFKYQNLIDQGIVFPFQDTFREKKPEAMYRASNLNIARHTSSFPVSMRLNGYIRVVPWEGRRALDEIDYWANSQFNIRGLKLHPRSDGWLDKVATQSVINVMKKAAYYNLPIIFDTRGKKTILDLGILIKQTRDILKKESPELIPNFKAIIAHAAAGNVNDDDVYSVISQPNTYMDMSLCQGKAVEQFFLTFRMWCERNQIERKTGRKWSEFCLYASDYPYFQELHAKSLIENIIQPVFFENGGTIDDIENILGLNQIKIFPEYGMLKPKKNSPKINQISTLIKNSNDPSIQNTIFSTSNLKSLMFQTIANLIDDDVIDIRKHIFQFSDNWSCYDNNALFVTNSKKDNQKIINLVLMEMIKGNIGLISSIADESEWNPMGFKFFNKNDNLALKQMFKNSTYVTKSEEASSFIARSYR